MKRLIFFILMLCSMSVRGANPSYNNFDTNVFLITGFTIGIKPGIAGATNAVTNLVGTFEVYLPGNKRIAEIDTNELGVGTLLGWGAGVSNTASGWGSTVVGYEALNYSTDNNSSTALGWRALKYLRSGGTNSGNTAGGIRALQFLTNGARNTVYGNDPLGLLNIGYLNTAYGWDCGWAMLEGSSNTLYGTFCAEGVKSGTNLTWYGGWIQPSGISFSGTSSNSGVANLRSSLAFGNYTIVQSNHSAYFGSSLIGPYHDWFFGGYTNPVPYEIRFHAPSGQGTDVTGGAFSIGGGSGTGAGAGGAFQVLGYPAGASGASLNAPQTNATFTPEGDLLLRDTLSANTISYQGSLVPPKLGFGGSPRSGNLRQGDTLGTIVTNTGVFASANISNTYNAFPGLVRLPNNHLMAFWSSASGHAIPPGDAWMNVSTDYGLTWSTPTRFYDPTNSTFPGHAGLATANAIILDDSTLLFTTAVLQTNGGVLRKSHLTYIKATVNFNDTPTTTLTNHIATNAPVFTNLLFNVFTENNPVQLRNGVVLWPIVTEPTSAAFTVSLLRSYDRGLTWTNFSLLSPAGVASGTNYSEGEIIELPNEQLLCVMRAQDTSINPGNYWYSASWSTDKGDTWSAPTKLTELIVGSATYTNNNGKPCLTLLPSGGILLMARYQTNRFQPVYSTSWNNGTNWTAWNFLGAPQAAFTNQTYVYASSVLMSDNTVGMAVGIDQNDNSNSIVRFVTFYDDFGMRPNGYGEFSYMRSTNGIVVGGLNGPSWINAISNKLDILSNGVSVAEIKETGAFRGLEGSLANPTYAFKGATNTGMKLNGTALSLQVAGAEAVRFTTSGSIVFPLLWTISGNFGFSVGPSSAVITNILSATASLDFPDTATLTSSDLPITVTGMTTNDVIALAIPWQATAGGGGFSYFGSNDTVWVRFQNFTGSSVNPATAVFRAVVTKVQ